MVVCSYILQPLTAIIRAVSRHRMLRVFRKAGAKVQKSWEMSAESQEILPDINVFYDFSRFLFRLTDNDMVYASPLRTRTSSPDLSKIWGCSLCRTLGCWAKTQSVFWHKGISIFIQQAIRNCLYKCLCEKGSLTILWPIGRKRANFGRFVSDWEWMYCEFWRTWTPSKMAENRHF